MTAVHVLEDVTWA